MKENFDFNCVSYLARKGIKVTPLHYIIDDLLNSLGQLFQNFILKILFLLI